MKKIKVNMLSETEFTVKGHGVHTAYIELTRALKKRDDIDVSVNNDRPVDVTHIQTVGPYALKRLFRAKGKKVVSAHLVPDSFIGSIRGAKYWKPLGRGWLKLFYSRADLVLACSRMVKDELEHDMGLKNVELLYNTIDMSMYHRTEEDKSIARKVLELNQDAIIVVGNGQIQPRKRFDVFVKMAQAMPEVLFVWIGGIPFKRLGAEYQRMKDLIDSTPHNLLVTDVIPLKEVRKYLHAADIFVLPAEQENHPMSVLEAAGTGLPIVLRKIPQYDDTFADAALLAANDDEFVSIVRELSGSKKKRAEAAQRTITIQKRFDSAEGASKAVAFYKQALKK